MQTYITFPAASVKISRIARIKISTPFILQLFLVYTKPITD